MSLLSNTLMNHYDSDHIASQSALDQPPKKGALIFFRGSRADSKTLEHGCRLIHAGFSSFLTSGLEEGHVPTFWLQL